jgi:hypothetical protein
MKPGTDATTNAALPSGSFPVRPNRGTSVFPVALPQALAAWGSVAPSRFRLSIMEAIPGSPRLLGHVPTSTEVLTSFALTTFSKVRRLSATRRRPSEVRTEKNHG